MLPKKLFQTAVGQAGVPYEGVDYPQEVQDKINEINNVTEENTEESNEETE